MKILDLYIIKKFLGTFFFAILILSAITVAIDVSERIDDFVEKKAPFQSIIFDYYATFLPHIWSMIFPLFVFIAVIFFTSQLAYRSEIVAILASGISFYRILFVPYFLAATLLFGAQLYLNHYFIPNGNKTRLAFEAEYIRNKKVTYTKNIHAQLTPSVYAYIETYTNRDSSGTNFTIEKIENRQLLYRLNAATAKWNTPKKRWELKNCQIRTFNANKTETLENRPQIDTIFADFTPVELQKQVQFKEAMTTPELNAFIEKETAKGGSGIEFYLVEKFRRTATPFATFILTAIGMAIASRKSRGGTGYHIFLGVAISATYIILLQFSTTFATKSNFSPMLSVWLPNIFVGILSLFIIKAAPK